MTIVPIEFLTPAQVNQDIQERIGIDGVSLGAALGDAETARKIAKELGIKGEAWIQYYKGRFYAVLKGNQKLRDVLKGTRYKVANPKMVQFAVGAVGRGLNAAKSIKYVAIAYCALEVIEAVLSNEGILTAVAKLVANVAKVIAASVIGQLVAAGVGVLFGGVFLGFAVMAVVAVAAGIALNYVDDKYHLTDKLVAAVNEAYDDLEVAIHREIEWFIMSMVEKTFQGLAQYGMVLVVADKFYEQKIAISSKIPSSRAEARRLTDQVKQGFFNRDVEKKLLWYATH